MFWKKLFGKKEAAVTEPVYRIADVDASDLSAYADGIDRLQNETLDGFIIRNVLNREQLDKIIEAHDKLGPETKYQSDTGMVFYPVPFSKIDQSSEGAQEELKKYFLEYEQIWKDFPTQFGVDFAGIVQGVLAKISSGRGVEAPIGINNVGKYSTAGLKHLIPGEGHFKAHCGNLFHKEFPTFYTHMNEISTVENQMSYFVMIDKPKKGGELTLYDVLWTEAEIRMKGDTVLKGKDGKLYDLENQKEVRRQYLDPGPGDMIVFSGGRIWHKVELVEYTRRLTCGGFVSLSKDDTKLYTWS